MTMKNFIKKKWHIILVVMLAIIMVAGALIILLFKFGKADGLDYAFAPFHDNFENQKGKNYESQDPNITFDGVLDEEVWKEQRWLEVAMESDDSIQVKMSSYFGEDGVYMAFDVDDLGVFYSKKKSAALNSGIQLYVSSMNGAENITDHGYEIMLTAGGNVAINKYIDGAYQASSGKVYEAIDLKGELNTMECAGYTMEVFLDYGMLEEDKTQLYASPAIVRTTSDAGEERQWYWFGEEIKGSAWTAANTWWTFDKNGLVAYDVTLTGDGNGALQGEKYVPYEEDYEFYITPNEGYYAEKITVNGSDVTDALIYSAGKAYYIVESVQGNLDIKATFAKLPSDTVAISGKITDSKGKPLETVSAWVVKNGFMQVITVGTDGSYSAEVPNVDGLKLYAEAGGHIAGITTVKAGKTAKLTLRKDYIGSNSSVNRESDNMKLWDFSRLYEDRIRFKSAGSTTRLVNSEIYSNSIYVSANLYLPETKGQDRRAGFVFYDADGASVFIALTMNGEAAKDSSKEVTYSLQCISIKDEKYSWKTTGVFGSLDNQDAIKSAANSKEGIPVSVHYWNGVFDVWVNGEQIGFGITPADSDGNEIIKSGTKMAVGVESWQNATVYNHLTFDGNYPLPSAEELATYIPGWDLTNLGQGTAKALISGWMMQAPLTKEYSDKISLSANISLPLAEGKDARAGFYFKNKRGDDAFVALTMNGEVSKHNPNGDTYYTLQLVSKGHTSWRVAGKITDIEEWNDVKSGANSEHGVPVSVYVENGLFTIAVNGYEVAKGICPADEDGNNIFAGDTSFVTGLQVCTSKVTFSNISVGNTKLTFKQRVGSEWDLSKLSEGEVALTQPIESAAILWGEYRDKIYLSSNVTLVPEGKDVRIGYRFTDEEGNYVYVCLLNNTKGDYSVQIITRRLGESVKWIPGCNVADQNAVRALATSAEGVPFAVAYQDGKLNIWVNNVQVGIDIPIEINGQELFVDGAKVSAGLECWSYAGQFHKLVAYDKRP